ncbi:hypothetical protein NMY22_g7967 [Coprinellus aureogranulatus]|nr:hypothetical protein NMY22_g7967 [Coprinellus aureogranulatus]
MAADAAPEAYICSTAAAHYSQDGRMEFFERDKLVRRIHFVVDPRKSTAGQDQMVNRLADAVIANVSDPMESRAIESALAEEASNLEALDLSYGLLAAAVELDNIYSSTQEDFLGAMVQAAEFGLLDEDFLSLVKLNHVVLEEMIDEMRDTYLS